MERWKEQAVRLVAEATRGYASVDASADELALHLEQGRRLTLKLAMWEDPTTSSPEPGTLWILKNPTRRTLDGLRASGASYAALNGSVRILGDGIVIDRTDVVATAPGNAPQRRSAFSDRASLVPRWLFRLSPDEACPVTAVAERSGVSVSVASYAVTDLEERRVLTSERRGRERRVGRIQHNALIRQWTTEYHWRKNYAARVNAPIGSPTRFLRRLGEQNLPRWAAAFHTGAQLYTPHTPPPNVQIYVDLPRSDLAGLLAERGWAPDEQGGLQLFIPHYRRSIWHWTEHIEDIPVVSELQVILDLWHHPLRGREQAEVLLAKHLRQWSDG